MSIFLRRVPRHLVPIDPLNATNKDWLILIEAGTIVGPSNERIRVARATQESSGTDRADRRVGGWLSLVRFPMNACI
jgi:hypothetical protein